MHQCHVFANMLLCWNSPARVDSFGLFPANTERTFARAQSITKEISEFAASLVLESKGLKLTLNTMTVALGGKLCALQ